jgi:hypothetical protein
LPYIAASACIVKLAVLMVREWDMTTSDPFKKKRKNYAGSEKPLPSLTKEKEPLWYRVP